MNITDDYNDTLSTITTNDYNNIADNCTINESNIDKIVPTLLLTILCGLSFLCLFEFDGVYTTYTFFQK